MAHLLPHLWLKNRWQVCLGLLVLAVLVRALVPAGFMPPASAAQPLQLSICSTQGQFIELWVTPEPSSAPEHGQAMPECPYGLLGNLATPMSPGGGLVGLPVPQAMAAAVSPRGIWPRYRAPLGPPLGSRAPPGLMA